MVSMVIGQKFVKTAEDMERRRKDALYAHEEAKDKLGRLIAELKAIGVRQRKVAALIERVEFAPENPLRSEVGLLTLTPDAFAQADFETVRALANSIAAARRELAEAEETKRAVGYRT